jgi:predicted transcriptional regulator
VHTVHLRETLSEETMNRDDTLALIANREELLRALEDGPVRKESLSAQVSPSKSTVDRGLRSLESHGLVERVDGEYRLTAMGRVLLSEYDRYTAGVAAVLDAEPVLSAIPAEVDLPAGLFVGATVFAPSPTDPYGPLEHGIARVVRADRVRSLVTAPLTRYAELFEGGLLPAEGRASICLSREALGKLVAEQPTWFETAIDRPDVAVLESPAEPPFTLALVDDGGTRSVTFAVFDDHGVSAGLTNDSPLAVEWADSFLDDWCADATTVSPPER